MLDERKGRILHAIVEDYVETADPIGSERLAQRYDFGCRSATLRNEMAEMSEMGYLLQPHTSAGRIPSDLGYRYYVDRLMPAPSVPTRATMNPQAATTVEEIVLHTCRMLSMLSRYPSAATAPSHRAARLHRLYVTPADRNHLLVVLLLSNGIVEHRIVEMLTAQSPSAVERCANFLNEALSGRTLDDIAAMKEVDVPIEIQTERPLARALFRAISRSARALSEERVYLEGTNQLLREPEFQDVARLEQILTALEERSALFEVFRRAMAEDRVAVFIGQETPSDRLKACSVVVTRYRIGNRTDGYIGIVGPTRMHYNRAVGAVQQMARNLSDLLTRHCLE